MNKFINQKGFTLIELMLAMTLFISVMMVVTVGFIGINRTFSKGLVRKQLSESVQRTVEDMTNTIRSNGGKLVAFSADRSNTLCSNSMCYVWAQAGGKDGGLYKTLKNENAISDYTKGAKLLDERFVVDYLTNEPVGKVNDLYRVKGMFRINEDTAFIFPTNAENVREPEKTVCKGSAQEGASQNCALEKFNFVVSTSVNKPNSGVNL